MSNTIYGVTVTDRQKEIIDKIFKLRGDDVLSIVVDYVLAEDDVIALKERIEELKEELTSLKEDVDKCWDRVNELDGEMAEGYELALLELGFDRPVGDDNENTGNGG